MSISTGHYINGQWTTRQVDVHHILAQNRQKDSPKSATLSPNSPQRPPSKGILTQKLNESPIIKWIIPARIRHESKNDVLFIYDTYIEIKEVEDGSKEGDMQTVAIKADFDSSIRSARIFGLPRKYTDPLPEGQDAIVKIEEMQDTEPSVPLRQELPPHVLVMALESKTLVFLTSYLEKDGQVQFVSHARALPTQESFSEQLGEHIAVDPKSRAMAVAGLEGFFTLYALKSMVDIKQETEVDGEIHSERFEPLNGERHILVDGIILKMEFLHPPEGDDDHVLLLIIVSNNRKSRLICYEWDCRTGLDTAQPKGNGRIIRSNEQLPHLLVPLIKPTAFMLVSENHITVYRDILTGNATTYAQPLYDLEPPEEPRSSKQLPIWTHWVRPSRHDLHVQKQDNIYLCRDDGVVHFLEIGDSVVPMLDCTHRVGILGVNIDTSFASIDLGAKGCDLLVAGGSMCDGGGWLFEPRESANKKFILPNWTPLIDFTVDRVSSVGDVLSRAGLFTEAGQSQQRLFAGTGEGSRHGAIAEIRYGVEACKAVTIDIFHSGVTQIWALEWAQGNDSKILLLLSDPTSTSVMILDSQGKICPLPEIIACKIDYNARTIAAATTREGLVILVTNSSIRALSHETNNKSFHQEKKIMAAYIRTIEDDKISAILLIAIQKPNGIYLEFGCLVIEGLQILCHSIGKPILLSCEPSFLSVEFIQGEFIAFVGTIESAIQIYHGVFGSGLTPIFEHKFEGQIAICDSIAVLNVKSELAVECLVVCGLRNGYIEVFGLNFGASSDDFLVFREKLQIGNTSVMIKAEVTNPSRAIILCEQKLYILQYHLNIPAEPQVSVLNSIWLTDFRTPSFQQGKIDSLTQACSGFARGWLLCVERGQIHVAALSQDPNSNIITRRMPLEGTPRRVIYSMRLKKLIVLYHKIFTNTRSPTNGHHVRANQCFLEPMIALIDPDADANIKLEPDGNDERRSVVVVQGSLNEKFLGVIEWYPEGNGEVYHMIVVNIMVGYQLHRQPSGRIQFYSVSDVGALTLKKIIDKDAPVWSLASYGLSSIIYCYGTNICLHNLEITPDGKKWQDPIILPLGSRGLYISINQTFVYVSTSENGLAIFKVEGSRLIHQFNDESARDDLYHLTLPEHSLVLTSQKSCTITGIWQPLDSGINAPISTVFEARLSGSISRFRRINRPLWQRSSGTDTPSETIYGSSIDGSIFQFEILDEPSSRLLVFIQNMASRNPAICPYSDIVQAHRQLLDPSPKNPFGMHVNGDILQRLIARGSERTLLSMLRKKHILKILLSHEQIILIMLAQHPTRGHIADQQHMTEVEVVEELASREAVARQDRITELAGEVGLTGENVLDLVQKVIQWMKLRLRKAV